MLHIHYIRSIQQINFSNTTSSLIQFYIYCCSFCFSFVSDFQKKYYLVYWTISAADSYYKPSHVEHSVMRILKLSARFIVNASRWKCFSTIFSHSHRVRKKASCDLAVPFYLGDVRATKCRKHRLWIKRTLTKCDNAECLSLRFRSEKSIWTYQTFRERCETVRHLLALLTTISPNDELKAFLSTPK